MKDDFYVNFNEIEITRVLNLLKQIINNNCEKGFTWFDDVDKNNMPTVIDILMFIRLLEYLKTNKEE